MSQPKALATALLAIIAVFGAGAYLGFLLEHSLEAPRRQGPPGMVAHAGDSRLWLLVRQEERSYLRRPVGSRWGTLYYLELHAHDTRTAERVWKRRLLTLRDDQGGHGAQARIFGQDGDVVWLFLGSEPVAVSAGDGSVVLDRAGLEAKNPELKGLIPSELKFYAYDGGLVITAADARRFRVQAPRYVATPYVPASEEAFQRLSYMSQTWNGGYQTADFLVRHGILWERWIGIYTPAEAADAANDEVGDKLKDASRVRDEGALARRTLWTARIGKTRNAREGQHDRLLDVERLAGAPEFLRGGFLVSAGTRYPLQLEDPDGALIVHQTRVDAQGRLTVTRLDRSVRERWRTELPFTELKNRWEWPDRLLMVGTAELLRGGVTAWEDFIVALDLAAGRVRTWNVTLERDAGRP